MTHPSRRRRARTALAAVAATALVAPAGALAAPSVFTQTAKVVPAGQTPTASWTQSDLADQQQYLVSENGFTLALRESNGKLDHGVLSFDVLPSAYRALFTPARWLAESATGVQPHATCDAARADHRRRRARLAGRRAALRLHPVPGDVGRPRRRALDLDRARSRRPPASR